jgi:3-deoxy-D-manno-octulosonate 8-phosphate phosphatase (KDO 8-P phosphatase)
MKEILTRYSKEIIEKALQVKALIFDVDGVMTDGRIIYLEREEEAKAFHVRDGEIIKHLLRAGIVTGIITGRTSEAVRRRVTELNLDFAWQGIKDKFRQYEKVKHEFNLSSDQIAYIGDDIPDLPLIKDCILGVCPADAPDYIKSAADMVTLSKGGEGVVREVAELILSVQGKFPV